jgi:hypothetical protein
VKLGLAIPLLPLLLIMANCGAVGGQNATSSTGQVNLSSGTLAIPDLSIGADARVARVADLVDDKYRGGTTLVREEVNRCYNRAFPRFAVLPVNRETGVDCLLLDTVGYQLDGRAWGRTGIRYWPETSTKERIILYGSASGFQDFNQLSAYLNTNATKVWTLLRQRRSRAAQDYDNPPPYRPRQGTL